MKIYVMRHGTTVWNEKGITQGHTNNRLSKNGKHEVEQVALMYKDVTFDVIFSSPLMRTMQTSNIMNKYHNLKIIKDKRLIEIDQGIFTGRRKNSLSEEERKLKFSHAKECGMESYESVCDRVKDFIDELLTERTYGNVLIVTHNVNAGLIFEILDKKVDFGIDGHLRSFDNAEVKCFEV